MACSLRVKRLACSSFRKEVTQRDNVKIKICLDIRICRSHDDRPIPRKRVDGTSLHEPAKISLRSEGSELRWNGMRGPASATRHCFQIARRYANLCIRAARGEGSVEHTCVGSFMAHFSAIRFQTSTSPPRLPVTRRSEERYAHPARQNVA